MKNNRFTGFSLIELLVVMAIIAIIATLAGPALVQIAQGQGVNRAITAVSDFAESARSQAMARGTYVFLGIADSSDANSAGNAELTLIQMASKNGLPDVSVANLALEGRPLRIENVSLTKSSTSGSDALGTGGFTFQNKIAGHDITFDKIIAFSPQGEASVKTNAVSPWIEIGFQQMRGKTPIEKNIGRVWVSGVSGQQLVLRDSAK